MGIENPTAEYKDFDVQSLTLEQIGFDLDFDLGNPNNFDIPLATLDWNLDLFDEPFSFGQILFEDASPDAPGIDEDRGILTYLGIETLPANGELGLNTPFNVAVLNTVDDVIRIVSGEDVPFTIGGTIHFESALGNFDLPFSQDGIWPNSDFVEFIEQIGEDAINDLLD